MVTDYIFTEIAYALSHNRLCLFTGSGFTKAITKNIAPSWDGLLREISINNNINIDFLKDSHLSLEEKAHLVSEILKDHGKSIYVEISSIIKKLKLSNDEDISNIKTFFENQSFHLITTNYDKLAESLANDNFHSLSPGKPIPKSSAKTKIYHIHGSVDSPDNMVVTAEDYFRFINYDSYFSRKLSVCLHENLVVILGYSLSDECEQVYEYESFNLSVGGDDSIWIGSIGLLYTWDVDKFVGDAITYTTLDGDLLTSALRFPLDKGKYLVKIQGYRLKEEQASSEVNSGFLFTFTKVEGFESTNDPREDKYMFNTINKE